MILPFTSTPLKADAALLQTIQSYLNCRIEPSPSPALEASAWTAFTVPLLRPPDPALHAEIEQRKTKSWIVCSVLGALPCACLNLNWIRSAVSSTPGFIPSSDAKPPTFDILREAKPFGVQSL